MIAGLPRRRRVRSGVATAVAALASLGAHAEDPSVVAPLPPVDVIATTPLPGFGVPLRDVPANVQVFGAAQLGRQRPLTLTQFLDHNANSVNAASGQGNAYQQSLDFRGFAASPLLGTPQGLSVFQDGVRINEAFGDVVNWDLLPRSAIATVQLVPGSVAAFGLNTLGGALAIYTKDGRRFPGVEAAVAAGSFGRVEAELSAGGSRAEVHGFVTAHVADDDGWATHNPSRIRQLFGKVGWQGERSDLEAAVTLADNALEGSQTLPLGMSSDTKQAYTYPDRNRNRLAFVTVQGSSAVAGGVVAGAHAYFRHYRSENVSSNVDDAFGDGEAPPARNERSTIDQRSGGAGAQLAVEGTLLGRPHRLAAGITADIGNTSFRQASATAVFTDDRGTVSTGPFVAATDVALRNATLGGYVTDTWSVAADVALTLSGRYDRAHVRIADRSGVDPALDGRHAFVRFTPAIGLAWQPSPRWTAYATVNEGMRAPTPIELTCADPEAPCRLPNQFLADPPLAKVVARTVETGARGRWHGIAWSGALYRTDLADDLQFIASGAGASNAGYFRNVGRTRRQGVELAASAPIGPFVITARYNHLDATFETPFAAPSPANSSADPQGVIVVASGNRLPGVPRDSLKLRVEWLASAPLSASLDLLAVSSQYARGDENNADVHGPLPGYFVARLAARYAVTPQLEVFVHVDNLFDRRYATYAQLGENAFTGPDGSFGPAAGVTAAPDQFRAWAAPRAVLVGLRYRFDVARGGASTE